MCFDRLTRSDASALDRFSSSKAHRTILIPPDSIQRLYEAAGEPRSFWLGPGVGHAQMFSTYPDEYEQRAIAFFDSSLLGNE